MYPNRLGQSREHIWDGAYDHYNYMETVLKENEISQCNMESNSLPTQSHNVTFNTLNFKCSQMRKLGIPCLNNYKIN